MKRFLPALAGLTCLAWPLPAQEFYRKHNFTVGMGAAEPRGDIKEPFSTAFLLNAGYGYRFHPYFQADVGFETGFGAADVREFQPIPYGGYLRIRDYQHFVPMGGRVIVPLASERLHLMAGGGGAYVRYSERLRQPYGQSGYYIDCYLCQARDGWGYYGLAGFSVALDQGRHFRIGATGKVYRAHTEGDWFGGVPPVRTSDRWVNIAGEFTFSF